MPGRVKLTVQLDPLQGQEHVFEEPAICTFGRADACDIRVPTGFLHPTVSRRHCVFDIDPPHARVRDLGSFNGTRVNGERIGQRPRGQLPEEVDSSLFSHHELHDGDVVQAGSTFIHVEIT